MTTFLALWLAHLLADFPLQTNRVFRLKIASNAGLALHVAHTPAHDGAAGAATRQPPVLCYWCWAWCTF
jgi:hypothetical protein